MSRYFVKQKLAGVVLTVLGVVSAAISGDATASILMVPLGITLIFTKNRIMDFYED